MRIVFCGTPEFAVPTLKLLLTSPEFEVAGAISQPDRARGRGQEVSPSPVKQAALAAGIPVHQPENIRSEESFAWLSQMAPEAVVIIAYGQIIPERLIALAKFGWINLHASLLPKYRGAAPINWAIVKGETRTGLTTMRIDTGMDAGELLLQREISIGAKETAPELARRMAEAGAPLVKQSLLGLVIGTIRPRAQDHSAASYAPRLKREDGRIAWATGAKEIYNRIRGFAPWPGAYTHFRGRICHVWGEPLAETTAAAPGRIILSGSNGGSLRVACGGGTLLRLDAVKIEGSKRISAQEFANGAHIGTEDSFAT
jgi:methionyl-tRNA formyltransferase